MLYQPDFDEECRECGASPCVVVVNHHQGRTGLCGPHFFSDRTMADWEEWNEERESTE